MDEGPAGGDQCGADEHEAGDGRTGAGQGGPVGPRGIDVRLRLGLGVAPGSVVALVAPGFEVGVQGWLGGLGLVVVVEDREGADGLGDLQAEAAVVERDAQGLVGFDLRVAMHRDGELDALIADEEEERRKVDVVDVDPLGRCPRAEADGEAVVGERRLLEADVEHGVGGPGVALRHLDVVHRHQLHVIVEDGADPTDVVHDHAPVGVDEPQGDLLARVWGTWSPWTGTLTSTLVSPSGITTTSLSAPWKSTPAVAAGAGQPTTS